MIMKIQRKHIGHTIDLAFEHGHTCPEDRTQVINGRIEKVKNKVASIRYWIPGKPRTEGYMTYIDVTDPRILIIY